MAPTRILPALSRRAALVIAAALVGAGGLAGEAILLSTSGLALGFGRASALGLALFVAGYAIGSWRAGRSNARLRPWLFALAALCVASAWLSVKAVLLFAALGWPTLTAGAIACLALAGTGAIQGALLPTLLRVDAEFSRTRAAAILFGANLAGSVLGARWIGFELVAQVGRSDAALVAGAASALGALLAAALARATADPQASAIEAGPASGSDLSHSAAAWLVGLGTAWMVTLEWVGLRHALLWLESQEATLNAILCASLIALSLGALLSSALPRGRNGVLVLIPIAILGTAWVAYGAPWASAHSAGSRILFGLYLLGPGLLAFGAWIPALYRASCGEVGARLGRLLLHEAWGALLGAPIAHALLVPHFGLAGALAALAALGLVLAFIARGSSRGSKWIAGAIGAFSLTVAVLLARSPEPALRSPLYANPSLSLRSFTEDAHFAVGVVNDGIQGELTLLTDRFRAAATGRDYAYMRALGHLPLLLHPAPRRVAVMCLGTGTTLGASFLHDEVEAIDVLELSPAVIAAAPWFHAVNNGALEPAAADRVHVRQGDGRRLLADSRGAYDVVTMEPLLPDSPFGVYLYTREFYAVATQALSPGGIVCQWVPPHALEPKVFDAVVDSFSRAFAWSGRFVFGTQLVLIGAERPPALDPARFPALNTPLGVALEAVSLHTAAALLSTFRGANEWPRSVRELSDDTPWIVFEDKPSDIRIFEWPGINLMRIESVGGTAPPAWISAAGTDAARSIEVGALVARARIEACDVEARLRGSNRVARDGSARDLERLASIGDGGPLARTLIDEQRFLSELRAGVASIAMDARAASERLSRAANLRPERADAQIYLATALQGLGNEVEAKKAYEKAFKLCPRILETSAGLRATKLGLREPR